MLEPVTPLTPLDHATHAGWMQHALRLAEQAAAAGEVPVGAVVVKDGRIIGEGANAPRATGDPTAHAEVLALRAAAVHVGNYRLEGCTLYVTLEPCTMCSGALLHARVDQVVYGAAEPKTGAAGSVLDVFALPQLNHHTRVVRGVLATECTAVLAQFFAQRRTANKAQARANHPLPDTAVRQPDTAFADLPNWPFTPQWRSDLPALHGLRMAVVDAGPVTAPVTWVCVHGAASWGFAFRHWVAQWLSAGHRVVVPDLPGFGRSDQPKRAQAHSAAQQVDAIAQLVEALQLEGAVLVGQGDGARLALAAAQRQPARWRGAWLQDVWPEVAPPRALQQWLQAAAQQSQWNVAAGCVAAGAGPLAGASATAMAQPLAPAGHRAVLKAWPTVHAQLPALPVALLEGWLQAGQLWLGHSAGNTLMPAGAWQAAWCAAVPALQAVPAQSAVWQQTPAGPLVPPLAADMAQRAVEYFSPTAR